MSKVKSNVMSDMAELVSDDPLIQFCQEFWRLEKERSRYLLDEEQPNNSSVSPQIISLQGALLRSLNNIFGSRPESVEALSAKYQVLKFRARAVEFQDPALFRAFVELIEDYEKLGHQSPLVNVKSLGHRSSGRRTWKDSLHGLFGPLSR